MLYPRLFSLVLLLPVATAGLVPLWSSKRGHTIGMGKPRVLAQFNWIPYQLTDVCLDCVRPNNTALYNCTLELNWLDPNSVQTNNVSSTTCSSTWSWDGVTVTRGKSNSYDNKYSTCWQNNPFFFAMEIQEFQSGENLTLGLTHAYYDNITWSDPEDQYPHTFSWPNLGLPLVTRSTRHIKYFGDGPYNATIMGLD
ncbi:hypothetical protein P8C59_004632 [Phyllachora maydis]|uniref:Uncharacterized protein n=1 Tax=Phyllachora maydis TaxID=1825666 RepID=A0AAD9I3R8_9PEZI|nr:hypothetical protein P8C59_004632 [Phyllachora maydis]